MRFFDNYHNKILPKSIFDIICCLSSENLIWKYYDANKKLLKERLDIIHYIASINNISILNEVLFNKEQQSCIKSLCIQNKIVNSTISDLDNQDIKIYNKYCGVDGDTSKKYGSEVFRTKIGEGFVVEGMLTHNAIISGEGNGGRDERQSSIRRAHPSGRRRIARNAGHTAGARHRPVQRWQSIACARGKGGSNVVA